MIADPLDIIDHMKKGAQALQVLNGQCGLVDLNQVVGNGMVQKVDILLHLIDFLDILLVQCDKGVHGTVKIFAGQRCHAVQFLDDFNHRRGGVENHFFPDIFQLELSR